MADERGVATAPRIIEVTVPVSAGFITDVSPTVAQDVLGKAAYNAAKQLLAEGATR